MSDSSHACSGGVEDTLSEEVELGASIHLAFEEFEPGHLALRLPVTVWKLAGGAHGGILVEARRETLQVWQPTRQDRLDPGLQLAGCPRPHHPGKGLRQHGNLGYRRIVLLELRHVRLLGWGALLRTTHEEIRELLGGQARRVGRPRRSGWARRVRGLSWLSAASGRHVPVHHGVGAREALRP
jgi:hypothetical protein